MDDVRRLAHDVRTPLHAARLAAKALRDGHDEELLDSLDASLEAILTIVRPDDAGDVDAVAVARRVAAAASRWFGAEGAEVEIAGEYRVRAGEGRVWRVLQNLLQNAVTHGGGDVRVYVDDGLHVRDGGGDGAPSPGEGIGWQACEEWVALDGGALERVTPGHVRVTWPRA